MRSVWPWEEGRPLLLSEEEGLGRPTAKSQEARGKEASREGERAGKGQAGRGARVPG